MLELQARLRELRRRPGYILAALFSLSAGMAVCLAVFSIVNTLVFADVPGLLDRTRLLRLTWSDGGSLSLADFESVANETSPSLGPVAGEIDHAAGVMLPSGVALLPVGFVSSDFFGALGTRPVVGRVLTSNDGGAANPPVVVISETLWRSAFAARPDTVGRTLVVAGRAFGVVGVIPHGFPGVNVADVGRPDSSLPQIFLPLRFAAMWPEIVSPTARSVSVAARLRSGARIAAARQELAAVGNHLPTRATITGGPASLRVLRMGLDVWDAPAESALVVLLFLFVPLGILGIGCANVVNLQLAHAVERAGELSVLMALGASGRRIALVLTLEVAPIAILAGGLGWLGARTLLVLAQSLVPLHFAFDARAALFAASIVGLSTTIAGAWPAWLASRDVVAAGLRLRQAPSTRTRIRQVLVVAQVGASVALVALAVLVARTMEARAPTLPADAHSILIAELNLRDANPGNTRAALFVTTILDAMAAESTIQSSGFADFFLNGNRLLYRVATHSDAQTRTAFGGVVSPGWFKATGTQLLAGRAPTSTGAQIFEAAVSSEFVKRAALAATAALGMRLRVSMVGEEKTVEIVGIVADGPPTADGRPAPMLILPMPATPPSSLVLTVRTTDIEAAKYAVRRAVQYFDPSIPFVRMSTLDDRMTEMFQGFKEVTALSAALATVALLLASVGLYALTSYTVHRRTPELAIRIAMGAQPTQILALVMRLSATLVLIGAVLGLAVATPVALVLRSAFFGLSPWSPWAMLPTIGLLLLVAAAATAVPAYRAVRVDPLTALRDL